MVPTQRSKIATEKLGYEACSTYSGIADYIVDGIVLEDFVCDIWRVPEATICNVMTTPCAVEPYWLVEYKRSCANPQKYGSPTEPFRLLSTSLHRSVKKALGEEIDSPKHAKGEKMSRQTLVNLEVITVLEGSPPPVPSCKLESDGSLTLPSVAIGQKRKHDGEHDDTPKKRIRSRPYTDAQSLLISEASLAMSASSRHYITGIHVDGSRVTLWYFDRCCLIRTAPFDFIKSPQSLALVEYALNYSGSCYGFDPFLVPANTSTFPADAPVKHVLGSDLYFASHIDGMGTRFRVTDELIYSCRSLFGRGTTVYPVSKVGSDGEPEPDPLALKVSWRQNTRNGEENFLIQLLYTLDEKWRDHLPQLVFHDVYSSYELELPSTKIVYQHPRTKMVEDRSLSVLVTPRYQHLWQVDNIDDFKTAFIHCVLCHYHAFKDARILHQDISECNPMFKHTDSGVKGVLNDWDMAEIVNHKGVVDVETEPIGTVPFMAIDLLEDNVPHRYEHDLESFFWLLVWATVHFDLKNKARLPTPQIASRWQEYPTTKPATYKRMFLYNMPQAESWFEHTLPEYEGLWDDWILPLRDLFAEAQGGRTGKVSFDQFMAVIQPMASSQG